MGGTRCNAGDGEALEVSHRFWRADKGSSVHVESALTLSSEDKPQAHSPPCCNTGCCYFSLEDSCDLENRQPLKATYEALLLRTDTERSLLRDLFDSTKAKPTP